LVVSTKVGGIPEVLPSNDTQTDIMILCEANINGKLIFIFEIQSIFVCLFVLDVFIGLCQAIDRIELGQIPNANQWHEKIKNWYSWQTVADQTEIVYKHIMTQNLINLQQRIQKFVLTINRKKSL